jgi:fatty acid desaturase
MGGWVRYLQLKTQAKIGLSSGVLIFAVLAVLCAAVTCGFLIFAAFIWLAQRYSPLTAALVLCGFFLLLTIIAGIGCLMAHRSTIESAETQLAARNNAPWLDPKMMGIGLQIGSAIGWRRLMPLAAVAVIAAGLAREWFAHDKPPQEEAGED